MCHPTCVHLPKHHGRCTYLKDEDEGPGSCPRCPQPLWKSLKVPGVGGVGVGVGNGASAKAVAVASIMEDQGHVLGPSSGCLFVPELLCLHLVFCGASTRVLEMRVRSGRDNRTGPTDHFALPSSCRSIVPPVAALHLFTASTLASEVQPRG